MSSKVRKFTIIDQWKAQVEKKDALDVCRTKKKKTQAHYAQTAPCYGVDFASAGLKRKGNI